VRPSIVRIGSPASSSSVSGLALTMIGYSLVPSLAVPDGRMTFCEPSAVCTSRGDSPRAWSRCGSMSIMTWRCLPPYGYGIWAPGIVEISERM
jgi:hypothetical protein